MEACPLPPLEAMACGCAVVSTACGGVEDYAENGVNCLLVPPGDPASLATAMWRACTDDHLRQRLARHGAITAQRFERDAMVLEFVTLVSKVLEETPSVPVEVGR
jgi:glycosyltransferase involved in cell wall biosynthesis